MPIGAGGCPAGAAAAGYGVPDAANVPNNAILPRPIDGLPQTGRALDPTTKAYTFTADGRIVGMPTVQQLVQLAITTDRGSSCVPTLGQTLRLIKEKGSNYAQQVTAAITTAVADLVNNKMVQIVSIDVQQFAGNPNAAIATFKWIDVSTGQQNTTTIGP